MRRVLVVGTSGSGKTTVGRQLAGRLGVPFVETDALCQGPNWTEASDDDLRVRVIEAMASEGWVIDNDYQRKLGNLVLDTADTVIWLDLPLIVTQLRLLRRTVRLLVSREELWNGNRQNFRGAFVGRESLFAWAIRSHFQARRTLPGRVATSRGKPSLVRLTSAHDVERWLEVVLPV